MKYELTTHKEHSYKVNRYHFNSAVTIETNGKAHVLSLVEGSSININSGNGKIEKFQYAESFIVPASVRSYTVTNNASTEAMLIVASMK